MKKSSFILVLFSLLMTGGCATTGLETLISTVITLPFEATGTIFREVDYILFGTEYEEDDTPTSTEPENVTEPEEPEEKKNFYRDENGNIRY